MDPPRAAVPWRSNPRRRVTVEITIFLYIAAYALEIPVLQQYLYDRAKQDLGVHHKFNDSNICLPNNSDTSPTSEKDVQKKASQYILMVTMALTLPAVVTACFIGAWTDKRGRKGPMLLVLIGSALNALLILISIYLDLPIFVIMIGCGFEGLCGYYPTMILALLAYAADTTPAERRAMKLGILEAIAFVSGMLSQLGSGYWINKHGYESVFLAMLCFHILGIIYIHFFLPESFPKELRDNTPICRCHTIKMMFSVYTKKRDGRWKLALLLISSVLMILATQVITTLIVLFGKRSPLCWGTHMIGYFLATLLCVKAVGAVAGIKLFSKFGFSNYASSQVGIIFLIASLIVIGFSKTTENMFIATGVGIFSGIPQPCIRAQMSKMVDKNEQGSLFAILAALESLSQFSSQLIFIPLYAWTVTLSGQFAAGISFFINAGLAVVPLALIMLIQCSESRRRHSEYPPLLSAQET